MVIMWIRLLLLFPFVLFSAEFTASVSRNEVSAGEGFVLMLTLSNASTKTSPAIEILKQSFTIHSQQRSSNTMIVNGEMTSSLSWTYTLIPRGVGAVQVPSIGIETSVGRLFTQPIMMNVSQNKPHEEVSKRAEMHLETEVNNPKPYKNEPFILTVRLTSQQALANVQLSKLELEGAIIDLIGEPVMGEKIEKGIRLGVLEFKYLVTPFKTGTLTIPAIVAQGGIVQTGNRRSIFDDPFMQAFAPLQPFAMATEERQLEVRSVAANYAALLPAKTLEIQELWDSSQVIQEGEVFSRTFQITAEGIQSSQLPSLEGKLDNEGLFKVYTDKPEFRDAVSDGRLRSVRIERYTLIPQTSGEVVLPDISVGWWDTEKEEKRNAYVPARTVHVLPAVNMPEVAVNKTTYAEEKIPEKSKEKNHSWIMYVLIGGLGMAFLITLTGWIYSQRKIKSLLKNVSLPRKKREELDELNPT